MQEEDNIEAYVLGAFCTTLHGELRTPYLRQVVSQLTRFFYMDCIHKKSTSFTKEEYVNHLADIMWDEMPPYIHGLAVVLGVPVKRYWTTIMEMAHIHDYSEWAVFWAYMKTMSDDIPGDRPQFNMSPIGKREQFWNRICSALYPIPKLEV